ncbi:GrpB family protein [Saccharothrix sp. 6-C]|nr:GrpB family protein [Saccharothrix sp. 6-C]
MGFISTLNPLWTDRAVRLGRPVGTRSRSARPHRRPSPSVRTRRIAGPLRSGARARAPAWTYAHIGSTAVQGSRAKRFVDLQLGTRAKSAFFRSTG